MSLSIARHLFFLLSATVLCSKAAAQDFVNTAFMETRFSGRIIDSLTRKPMPSAVISVINTQHKKVRVKNYTTDKKGRFAFTHFRTRDLRMEVSHVGYKLKTVFLDTDAPDRMLGDILMPEDIQAIDDVVVKARMELYRIKGDTMVLIPRAVKTMEGDKALEILRNMPGVEVTDDGSVTVMGQPVTRTYVNKRLLFGENPRTALKQLDASEVASIQAYDEVDEEAVARHGKNAKKRKALNITTFQNFSRSLSANLCAEAGTDFNSNVEANRPARYAVAADGGYYDERLQATINGSVSNLTGSGVGQTHPGSRRVADAAASVAHKINETHSYSASYNYGHKKTETWQTSDFTYFPTDYFSAKHSADTTRSKLGSGTHAFGAAYAYEKKRFRFNVGVQGDLADNYGLDSSTSRTDQDDALLLAINRRNVSDGEKHSLNINAQAVRSFANESTLSGNFSYRQSDDRTLAQRRDRLFSTAPSEPELLRTTIRLPGRMANGLLDYETRLGEQSRLTIRTTFSANEAKNRTTVIDPLTGQLQRALSDHSTDRLVEWSPTARYSWRNGKHDVSLNATYQLSARNYENPLFGNADKKSYHLFVGDASYGFTGEKNSVGIYLSNSFFIPPGQVLSSRIDDTSPLFLSTGNPAIRATKNYNLQLSFNHLGKQSSFQLSVSTQLSVDPITTKITYFQKDTPLEHYGGYVVPAGATLSAPVNGSNTLQIMVQPYYKNLINPLRCFFEMQASYNFSNPEEDLGDGLRRTREHWVYADLSLTSNFSRQFRLVLRSETRGQWNRNSRQDRNNHISQSTGVSFRWDLLRRCILKGTYGYALSRNTIAAADSDEHLLNISFGYRLLDRRATLSFNAYDILNQQTGIRVGQGPTGVSISRERLYASYFTFAFEYKFNRRK